MSAKPFETRPVFEAQLREAAAEAGQPSLKWEVRRYADIYMVVVETRKVEGYFLRNKFGVKPEFYDSDPEGCVKWLLAQALECIKAGKGLYGPHPTITKIREIDHEGRVISEKPFYALIVRGDRNE